MKRVASNVTDCVENLFLLKGCIVIQSNDTEKNESIDFQFLFFELLGFHETFMSPLRPCEDCTHTNIDLNFAIPVRDMLKLDQVEIEEGGSCYEKNTSICNFFRSTIKIAF